MEQNEYNDAEALEIWERVLSGKHTIDMLLESWLEEADLWAK